MGDKSSKPDGLILARAKHITRRRIGFHAADLAEETRNELIAYPGDGHLITIAPTGTGKTSGPVITNALLHKGQLIVIDLKGEVFNATAAARKAMGQVIHVIDLTGHGTKETLNPLDLARLGGAEIATVARSIAVELVARTNQERDPFWSDWAETLIAAGIMWQLADRPPGTGSLAAVYDLLTGEDPDHNIATHLDEKRIRYPGAQTGFAAYLNLPERETRPSVLASAQGPLRLFDSELVQDLTSTTSIDLEGLIAGEPMSIYIIVPPARLRAYAPLLHILFTGLVYAFTERPALPEHRTLILCDEIASLGRMEAFLTATTLLRGWGVTFWSFWQNVAQMQIYGDQARTILDNAGVIQLFGARNRRMAEDFASIVGGIDADEILSLAADEQLLLIEGGRPIRCAQVRHYQEPTLNQGKGISR